MRLAHVQRLFRYWGRQPPGHELAAARLGLKDPGPPSRAAPGFTAADLAQIDALATRMGLA